MNWLYPMVFLLMLLSAGCSTIDQQGKVPFQTKVHFKVKWPDSTNPPASLGLRGSINPLSWERTFFLSGPDSAGFFTGSVQLQINHPVQSLQWKLIANDTQWELEGFTNRREWLYADSSQVVNARYDNPDHPDSVKISAEGWQQDIRLLTRALAEFHPSLYRFQDRDSYLSQVRMLENSRPVNQTEAYRLMTAFLSSIRCSHTWANRYNQAVSLNKYWLEEKQVLPFFTNWIEGSFIISDAIDTLAFPVGSRLMTIDSISADSVASQLFPLTRADGTQHAKRMTQLCTGNNLQVTDLFLNLTDSSHVTILTPDSRVKRMDVSGTTFKQRQQQLQRPADPWTLTFHQADRLAIMKLNSFTVWNFGFDWKKKLEQWFSRLAEKKTPHLIIDIRENEGGADEVISELTRYVIDQTVTWKPGGIPVIRYETVPDSLRPFLSTWEPSWFDRRGTVKPTENGFYELTSRTGSPVVLEPANNRFNGTVWLLTSPINSSATHHLAVLWNQFKLSIQVGTETGGNLKGSSGGQFFFLHLPNSGLEVDIPLLTTLLAEPGPDTGLVPDLPAEQTIGDFLNHRDTAIERVLEEIRK